MPYIVKMDKLPPKLKVCKKCPYNIGDDKSGLCATCDPNHRWWKRLDTKVDECIQQIEIMTIQDVQNSEKRILEVQYQ